MRAKNQRLMLVVLAIVAVVGAVLLAMSALGEEAAFFYAPADAKAAPIDKPVRLGGMVAAGSVAHAADGVTITFTVTDGTASIPVRFAGIAPDLFREGSGVVAEGRFVAGGGFVADNLLAKHDERYMPPQAAGAMHKTESLKR
ncbi:cytochrome c maturation protein CcmE [Sphingomonas sp. Leaf4]|uniref:cytochrome c maturation protein CcmE n=1 Tax=Sphingomonas sp. Leaf4 TaxID=2876553 RepID=UPI001E4BDF6B|nr:cytochrome c maturation protein CcmE [Sphingomonas sp. Leaf4]